MKGRKWIVIGLLGLLFYVEHFFHYGGFDWEILGHEIYGIVLMILSILMFYRANLKQPP